MPPKKHITALLNNATDIRLLLFFRNNSQKEHWIWKLTIGRKTSESIKKLLLRRSREGGDPGIYAPTKQEQSSKRGFVRYAELYDKLDSGFRRNDVL